MKSKGIVKLYLAILDRRKGDERLSSFEQLNFVKAFTKYADLDCFIKEYKLKHPSACFFTPTINLEVDIII